MSRPPAGPLIACLIFLSAGAGYLMVGARPAAKSSTTLAPPAAGAVRIVSWNPAWTASGEQRAVGRDRSAEIAETLSRLHADAVCLQNIVDAEEAGRIAAALGDGWTAASVVDGSEGGAYLTVLLSPSLAPMRRELIVGGSGYSAIAYLARAADDRTVRLVSMLIDRHDFDRTLAHVDELTDWLDERPPVTTVLAVGAARDPSSHTHAARAVDHLRARLAGRYVEAGGSQSASSAGRSSDYLFTSAPARRVSRFAVVVAGTAAYFDHKPLVVDVFP